jgi:hypothetical protein
MLLEILCVCVCVGGEGGGKGGGRSWEGDEREGIFFFNCDIEKLAKASPNFL